MSRSLMILGLALYWACMETRLHAASTALIVTGLSGSSANEEEFQGLATKTKDLLVKRGMPEDRVEVLSANVTRDRILQSLKKAAAAAPEDEFWFVLFGLSAKSQEGVPAFQVKGPRLTATDMKAALAAIPAKKFVFIGTSESGGYLPVLQSAQASILSATKGGDESDRPRFPDSWIAAFAENPHASFQAIAARAAALVEQQYKDSQIAQSEHARLADPVTGKILEPPFGENTQAVASPVSSGDGHPSLFSASDIQVKMDNPDAEWEHHPATEETKKIMAEAHAAPNPDSHGAIMLEQKLGFTVEDDRTTDQLTYFRVYLAREDVVGEWANRFFPQSPPGVTSKLEAARVIQPDGSSMVYNPAKLKAAIDPNSPGCCPMVQVFLPSAHAGCVVEMGYRVRQLLDATLPYVSESFPVQQDVPVLKSQVEVRVPQKTLFHVALKNVSAPVQETTENGRKIYRWELGPLLAAETLPGDPPPLTWIAWVGISSLPTWDDFALWYRKLADGSDTIDDSVRKAAAELADGAKSRTDKIRRSFEFVSALRYIAIELGVQGFRPRTPIEVLAHRYGDCKDKANLLVALLRCQGIEAQFVLLNRSSTTDITFPSWQFNHAICYVPPAPEAGQPDAYWLDATDSVTPFGVVSRGDQGRAGLVFSKDKAEFKTITGGLTMELSDRWELAQDTAGGWKGTFQRQASGLADDGLRRAFRGLSPLQRKAQLYALLGQVWPSGDFQNGTVGDVSALQEKAILRADVATGLGSLPGMHSPELVAFSSPARNRPLFLNDGQPFTLKQSMRLRYTGHAPQLPPAWQAEVAGRKLNIAWERIDDHTIQRNAVMTFPQPIVSAEDYAAVRHAVRDWSNQLTLNNP